MTYWLTRDKDKDSDIEFWNKEPKLYKGRYIGKNKGFVYYFCPAIFKSVTSVFLKPGEIRKVKSIKIELI